MNDWVYPGARWWKFDFHTHTPASDDFLQGCEPQEKSKVTPEFWLRKFMEKGIDCVAITDHNSGAWIDKLKQALTQLVEDENKPEWFHPIHLFPGVEISTSGGAHLLAIFDPEKNTSEVDSLLGTVGFGGKKGTSDSETNESLINVIDEVVKAGAIPIPAHVDKEKGLFQLQGTSLNDVLTNKHIYAMELCCDGFNKPQLYKDKKLKWTEVRGSDTHNFRSRQFGVFTWLKMDKPSIEGVKLALLDGPASVKREMQVDPNRHSEYVRQGSPGQKTAALLAFILSYGEEPLLLDQPEDDLDNVLIYDLIVKQLRETKSKRQIIVVTHNANIVVNGDDEMVLPLIASGQSSVKQPASIQEVDIRKRICTVLEGGQRAFEQRYKRIHLEA